MKVAAVQLRTALTQRGLDAVVGIDSNGATLWVPFEDGPRYEPLRAWFHDLADETIAAHPDVFTYGHEPNRIRIDLGPNATGRWSAWPYSIRGNAALTMLTPVSWADLAAAKPATLQTALKEDVFGNELARIKPQRFNSLQPTATALLAVNVGEGHSHVVSALKQLLADGKARAADDLCAAGIAAKLLPPKSNTSTPRFPSTA